jgi:hypothetical protein
MLKEFVVPLCWMSTSPHRCKSQAVQHQPDIDEDEVEGLRQSHQQAFTSEGRGPQGMAPDAMGGAAAFKVTLSDNRLHGR